MKPHLYLNFIYLNKPIRQSILHLSPNITFNPLKEYKSLKKKTSGKPSHIPTTQNQL